MDPTTTTTLPTSTSNLHPVLTQSDTFWATVGLIALILATIAVPLVYAVLARGAAVTATSEARSSRTNGGNAIVQLLNIHYITWFFVHYGVALVAILAIVILGLNGIIDTSTVAALLGSLFSYALSSAVRRPDQSGGAGVGAAGSPNNGGANAVTSNPITGQTPG